MPTPTVTETVTEDPTASPTVTETVPAPVESEPVAPPPPPPPQTTSTPPEPEPEETTDEMAYYEDCDAARAAGAAPLLRGEPGYRDGLDRDGDGIACEVYVGP
ncbi:excalibur calcium-binding domain-containing protein [Streptomyces sp. ISL-36]|nr:excalibur calcium-binding domain-containing protein [Streptomyces sp. ISL-36]